MYWGPTTWCFMHTLASKVKEDSFPIIASKLILVCIQICSNLPCPECTQHARQFWSNVNLSTIKTKQDLINVLFVFHSSVNKRKKLKPFPYDGLSIYNDKNLIEVYNSFTKNFNTNGNMNMINESFHRNRMLSSLRAWMYANLKHFDIPLRKV